jgi:hypothetical protein
MKLSILIVLSLGIAQGAFCQVKQRPLVADSSPARIMVDVGSHPGAPWLRDILRQANGQYSRSKLDEIADSLVGRAIAFRGTSDTAARRQAADALGALVLAGSPAGLGGQPYDGALDRLIKAHRDASAKYVRQKALTGMLSVAGRARALAYLSNIAESNDPTAYDAVNALVVDANGGSWTGLNPTAGQQRESISALKELATRGEVRNRAAAVLLEKWFLVYQSRHPT